MEVTVLVCDDSEAVHRSLKGYFRSAGIDMVSAYSGPEALTLLKTSRIDLVILDIMMPVMSGTEVCGAIRKTSDVPIIMLSARGEEPERVRGLELGADDYIAKPFSPREVVTRVSVILRRTAPGGQGRRLSFMELRMDLDASQVWINDQRLEFTVKEKAMLELLISHPGVALSRDRIMDAIWGDTYFGDARAVDTLVKRIRKKLPDHVNFAITSVYGLGYKLEERPEN